MSAMRGVVGTNAAAAAPRLSRDDIERARRALAGRVVHTPVVCSQELDRLAGARLWLKAENLQHGGSFKLRGALLAMDRLAAAASRGVVAQSTGNHAIAVALAAREHGLPAVLVLPRDAAPAKIRLIRAAGAEVVEAGTLLAERIHMVGQVRTARGYDVVDPYESTDVVTGQGTATAELLDQAAAAGARLAAVVVPVGGGSGVAGACLAAAGSGTKVVAAEPAAVPALTHALAAGHPVTVPAGQTIADGLRPDRIGRLPFGVCRDRVAAVETVTEQAIGEATCLALLVAKLLAEPAAATALAVALRLAKGGQPAADIGVLITGGNAEPGVLASLLADYRPSA